ncbi:uncharacterized protein LOC119316303 [Triticum dicoccoides]|uniref:uncharacterized protein LOC119316303 n=1 Tax=Triticum dicoccoides TaxID=85692 RepID=UPI001891A7CF|nr:uncharacterized protein LOC119316303 [Triticum dicoccoides]
MPVITEDGQPIEDPNSNGEQQTNNGSLPKEVIQWKLLLHQIGLDVNQIDRTLVYYESQENLARDILTVYAWVDTDIGYCQGMSDLCSPISIILEHEADAFWCFERLMRRVAPMQLSHRPYPVLNVPPPMPCAKSTTALRTQASHAWAIPLIDLGSGRWPSARRNSTSSTPAAIPFLCSPSSPMSTGEICG